MSYAAVIVFVVGAWLSHEFGDVLAGIGQFLVGLAAVLAAAASLRNVRQLTHVKTQVGEAATKAAVAADKADVAATVTADVSKSIGPSNGTNVLQLLHEIKSFEEYQHGRNHDLLSGLTQLSVAQPTLMSLLEQVAELLRSQQPPSTQGASS